MSRTLKKNEGLRVGLPNISQEALKTLLSVSVYRVPDRDAARSFIGFKHINGPAKWDSYAKAKFVADWYEISGISLQDIAEKIGDQHATVKRMVLAIYVLEQAEREGKFLLSDRKSARFNFSHLYTALARNTYMTYLGIETKWAEYTPQTNPVHADKLDRLREVLIWIYGSKEDDQEPVVRTQNPDIERLGEILGSNKALHILRAGGTLTEAYDSLCPADQMFAKSLVQSRHKFREVANNLRGYDGRDKSLLDIAGDVSETTQIIYERMEKKHCNSIGGSHDN